MVGRGVEPRLVLEIFLCFPSSARSSPSPYFFAISVSRKISLCLAGVLYYKLSRFLNLNHIRLTTLIREWISQEIMTACMTRNYDRQVPIHSLWTFSKFLSINQWATGVEISLDVVRKEIEELLNELKDHMENQLEGQKVVLAIDRWTNSVTKDKHLCFVILPIEESTQPVFYESFILLCQSTINIQWELSRIHSALTENQINVVAIIADNAKACQSAIFNFTAQTNNRIVEIRCADHVLILTVRKASENFLPLKKSNWDSSQNYRRKADTKVLWHKTEQHVRPNENRADCKNWST